LLDLVKSRVYKSGTSLRTSYCFSFITAEFITSMKTLVMKFGGAAVATPAHFSHIADLVISRLSDNQRAVIVVSAMGETTNQLIELAKQVHPQPPQREYDMLISAGERISMSLLAMAFCRKGIEALSFTGSQSGIITCGRHTQASIIDVKPYRLADCLLKGKIAIVAGFQGVSMQKEITTLGRGGSDTSAVALALALGSLNFDVGEVEFFKDVTGIFNEDPKKNKDALQYVHMTYDQALTVVQQGAKVLHDRAIRLAAKNGLPLQVRSFISSNLGNPGTKVFDPQCERKKIPVYEEA
jgi:aspartate kinase